jgi:hypothetical protein
VRAFGQTPRRLVSWRLVCWLFLLGCASLVLDPAPAYEITISGAPDLLPTSQANH